MQLSQARHIALQVVLLVPILADLGGLVSFRMMRLAHSTLGQPVMRVVMAVYRQGDIAVRARCLDVIDRLSERDAYGWRELIEDER